MRKIALLLAVCMLPLFAVDEEAKRAQKEHKTLAKLNHDLAKQARKDRKTLEKERRRMAKTRKQHSS